MARVADAVDDQLLFDAFSQCGQVDSATVVRDHATGRSRGFGYVRFYEATGVQTALTYMGGQSLGGQPSCMQNSYE